ncbi:MAG: septal ring lytic transglycosylase RlpA family protein [Chitinophagales bacterium]|nr:septal ring lytic transglycosylase RlpA family protein [Bacteroidota bacterium]
MKKTVVSILFIFSFLFVLSAQTEYGIASYYGSKFHGRTTASGEKYNQYALTAAHKTLPLGTVVKVTNLKNDKSVFVKINDRGPYVKGRVIDLSTKAAELLGYRNKGTTKVKIEIVDKDIVPDDLLVASTELQQQDIAKQNGINTDTSSEIAKVSVMHLENDSASSDSEKVKEETTSDIVAPSFPPQMPITEVKDANSHATTNRNSYFVVTKLDNSKKGFYGLQLGVFSDMNVILAIIAELEAKYNQNMLVLQEDLNGKTVYKLYVGKYQNRAYADALKSVLADKYNDAFVVKYE